MQKVNFTKMVASGNDFVVIEDSHKSGVILRQAQDTSPKDTERSRSASHKSLAKNICDRKYGIGADGLLVLEKSKLADVKMRIFNPDGSEAQMCGNGARCVALYEGRRFTKIETKAGIIESTVTNNNIKIKLTDPKHIKLDIPIKVNKRNLKVNFIDVGVPHAVIFVEGLDEIYVTEIGRAIRNHKKFAPSGTNVDFVEVLGKNLIGIRTYERGVEDETLACGTGAVASALILATRYFLLSAKVNVQTKSKEILKVYFNKVDNKPTDVWLEGKAKIVYKGEYNV